jgi:hypothetical protein
VDFEKEATDENVKENALECRGSRTVSWKRMYEPTCAITSFGDVLTETENLIIGRLGMETIDEVHDLKSDVQRFEKDDLDGCLSVDVAGFRTRHDDCGLRYILVINVGWRFRVKVTSRD